VLGLLVTKKHDLSDIFFFHLSRAVAIAVNAADAVAGGI
jgi:hypothetical protein